MLLEVKAASAQFAGDNRCVAYGVWFVVCGSSCERADPPPSRTRVLCDDNDVILLIMISYFEDDMIMICVTYVSHDMIKI